MSKCEERGRGREVETKPGAENDEDAPRDDAHLDELPDGAGCTGIWEYLSSKREFDDD